MRAATGDLQQHQQHATVANPNASSAMAPEEQSNFSPRALHRSQSIRSAPAAGNVRAYQAEEEEDSLAPLPFDHDDATQLQRGVTYPQDTFRNTRSNIFTKTSVAGHEDHVLEPADLRLALSKEDLDGRAPASTHSYCGSTADEGLSPMDENLLTTTPTPTPTPNSYNNYGNGVHACYNLPQTATGPESGGASCSGTLPVLSRDEEMLAQKVNEPTSALPVVSRDDIVAQSRPIAHYGAAAPAGLNTLAPNFLTPHNFCGAPQVNMLEPHGHDPQLPAPGMSVSVAADRGAQHQQAVMSSHIMTQMETMPEPNMAPASEDRASSGYQYNLETQPNGGTFYSARPDPIAAPRSNVFNVAGNSHPADMSLPKGRLGEAIFFGLVPRGEQLTLTQQLPQVPQQLPQQVPQQLPPQPQQVQGLVPGHPQHQQEGTPQPDCPPLSSQHTQQGPAPACFYGINTHNGRAGAVGVLQHQDVQVRSNDVPMILSGPVLGGNNGPYHNNLTSAACNNYDKALDASGMQNEYNNAYNPAAVPNSGAQPQIMIQQNGYSNFDGRGGTAAAANLASMPQSQMQLHAPQEQLHVQGQQPTYCELHNTNSASHPHPPGDIGWHTVLQPGPGPVPNEWNSNWAMSCPPENPANNFLPASNCCAPPRVIPPSNPPPVVDLLCPTPSAQGCGVENFVNIINGNTISLPALPLKTDSTMVFRLRTAAPNRKITTTCKAIFISDHYSAPAVRILPALPRSFFSREDPGKAAAPRRGRAQTTCSNGLLDAKAYSSDPEADDYALRCERLSASDDTALQAELGRAVLRKTAEISNGTDAAVVVATTQMKRDECDDLSNLLLKEYQVVIFDVLPDRGNQLLARGQIVALYRGASTDFPLGGYAKTGPDPFRSHWLRVTRVTPVHMPAGQAAIPIEAQSSGGAYPNDPIAVLRDEEMVVFPEVTLTVDIVSRCCSAAAISCYGDWGKHSQPEGLDHFRDSYVNFSCERSQHMASLVRQFRRNFNDCKSDDFKFWRDYPSGLQYKRSKMNNYNQQNYSGGVKHWGAEGEANGNGWCATHYQYQ
ncbi:unnamed protein product [Amoebophrya sp. A120]|nr:unnamed protein product [Amoebophrya sp. A120]|eukprot:GSA120T00000277001.1